MFKSKKKSEFPDLPQPPTWKSMEEDLKDAPQSDIVFTFAQDTHKRGAEKRYDKATVNSDDPEGGEPSPEELFERAVKYVQMNDELKANMTRLEENQELLKIVSENLKDSVGRVKTQALGAITSI